MRNVTQCVNKTQCLEVEADGTYNYQSALKFQNHFKCSTENQQGLQMIISKPSEAAVLYLESVNRCQGNREFGWQKLQVSLH